MAGSCLLPLQRLWFLHQLEYYWHSKKTIVWQRGVSGKNVTWDAPMISVSATTNTWLQIKHEPTLPSALNSLFDPYVLKREKYMCREHDFPQSLRRRRHNLYEVHSETVLVIWMPQAKIKMKPCRCVRVPTFDHLPPLLPSHRAPLQLNTAGNPALAYLAWHSHTENKSLLAGC